MREISIPSNAATLTQNNVANFVFDNATQRPDHAALRVQRGGTWRTVTSASFAAEVTDLAKGLIAAGLEVGDRVALMSKTRYEWTVADMAMMAIGIVVVPIYDTSSAEQVTWIISDSGAKAVFVETPAQQELVESVRSSTPKLGHIWRIEGDAFTQLGEAGASIADADVTERRASVASTDTASIIYTSGTTGRPKGCELTHANFVAEVVELQAGLSSFFNDQTSTLLFLPIAHVFGRAIEIGCLATGCTLGHSDVANLIADLADFKPTFLLSVPRVFEKVYNTAKQRAHAAGKGPIFDRADKVAIQYSEGLDAGSTSLIVKLEHLLFDRLVYGKLRAALGGQCRAAVSGGAPLGERLGHFFRGIGVPIYEGYGLTETTAGICINVPGAMKVGTVGRPVGGASARVADDGELLLRGGVVFEGYWHNEAASKEVFDSDGWFASGDIGEIDEDGFVRITGRKKELIVTAAGKNVAPAVLEDRVRSHWLISQCLVVGDQQPYIAALVTIDPEALPQWLAGHDRPAATELAELVDDPQLRADVQSAIDDANQAVSQAEAIKKFVILDIDWTEASGQVTPSLKLKRNVVLAENATEIAALYAVDSRR